MPDEKIVSNNPSRALFEHWRRRIFSKWNPLLFYGLYVFGLYEVVSDVICMIQIQAPEFYCGNTRIALRNSMVNWAFLVRNQVSLIPALVIMPDFIIEKSSIFNQVKASARERLAAIWKLTFLFTVLCVFFLEMPIALTHLWQELLPTQQFNAETPNGSVYVTAARWTAANDVLFWFSHAAFFSGLSILGGLYWRKKWGFYVATIASFILACIVTSLDMWSLSRLKDLLDSLLCALCPEFSWGFSIVYYAMPLLAVIVWRLIYLVLKRDLNPDKPPSSQ
jgi:hypothetical protein